MRKKRKVSITAVKRQFSAVGLSLILYVLFVIAAPLVISYYLHVEFGDFVNMAKNQQFIAIYSIFLILIIGTIIPFWIMMKSSRVKFTDFYRKSNITWLEFFADLLVYLSLGTGLLFILSTFNGYFNLGDVFILPIGISSSSYYYISTITTILYIVAMPFVEEFAFRGVLLRVLGRYNNFFAMITVSLIYALMHKTLSQAIIAFVLSIFLVKLTLRSHSIQPSIFINICFNLVTFVLRFFITDHYYLVLGMIILIYVLCLVMLSTKTYRRVRLKRSPNRLIARLFYTRITVVIALLGMFIALGYNTYTSFFPVFTGGF